MVCTPSRQWSVAGRARRVPTRCLGRGSGSLSRTDRRHRRDDGGSPAPARSVAAVAKASTGDARPVAQQHPAQALELRGSLRSAGALQTFHSSRHTALLGGPADQTERIQTDRGAGRHPTWTSRWRRRRRGLRTPGWTRCRGGRRTRGPPSGRGVGQATRGASTPARLRTLGRTVTASFARSPASPPTAPSRRAPPHGPIPATRSERS